MEWYDIYVHTYTGIKIFKTKIPNGAKLEKLLADEATTTWFIYPLQNTQSWPINHTRNWISPPSTFLIFPYQAMEPFGPLVPPKSIN